MRALTPRSSGEVISRHDGVKLHYEEFGDPGAERTVVLLPTWSLVHSRVWKMQVPFLAQRGYRVVTFDGRGNGLSERPALGYATDDFVRDTEAVMDRLRLRSAILVGFSAGGRWAVQFAAQHATRVEQLVLIAPATVIDDGPRLLPAWFTAAPPDREGWNKFNAVHWREDYRDFVTWFASMIFTEAHSTKGQDDIVLWASDTTPAMLIQTILDSANPRLGELWRAVDCPVLIVHGSRDAVVALENSHKLLAARPATRLMVLEDCGHAPHIRDAVKTNLVIERFLATYLRQVPGESRAYARA